MVRFSAVVLVWFAFGAFGADAATSKAHRERAEEPGINQALNGTIVTASAVAGPETTIPYGWVDFCRRYPGECDVEALPPADVEMTAATWRSIERVNRSVNAAIEPISDMDHWGVVDQWDYPTDGKGDCEDYALVKRRLLIAAGLPRQALLITVVRDRAGEGHAVLTVKSNRGDYVLDNMSDAVQPWTATGYRFVKRQSQTDPNVWLTLHGQDVPDVAATP